MGENARICSRHFYETDFVLVNGKRKLKKDAIPRLFLTEIDEQYAVAIALNDRYAKVRVPLGTITNQQQIPSNSDSDVGTIRARLQLNLLASDSDDPVGFKEKPSPQKSTVGQTNQLPQSKHLSIGLTTTDQPTQSNYLSIGPTSITQYSPVHPVVPVNHMPPIKSTNATPMVNSTAGIKRSVLS